MGEIKITKCARDCANSLKEDDYIKEEDKELVSLRIQTYMMKYCNKLQEIVDNYESLNQDHLTNLEDETG